MEFSTVEFNERFQKAVEKMAEKGEVYLIETEWSASDGRYQTIDREIVGSIDEIKKHMEKVKVNCLSSEEFRDHWFGGPLELLAEPELIYEVAKTSVITVDGVKEVVTSMATATRIA